MARTVGAGGVLWQQAGNGERVTDDLQVRKRKLTEYTPDPRNANKGTERGQYMVDASIEQVGAGRSLVATADGVIAAGNKTMQALVDAGIVDVIEVETDGRTAVVVKRKDWGDIENEQARKYAYFDNRASEVGLAWDAEQILADLDSGLDLSALFREDELDTLLALVQGPPSLDDLAEMYGDPGERDFWPFIRVQVSPDTFELWRSFMGALDGDDEAEKVARILGAVDAVVLGAEPS